MADPLNIDWEAVKLSLVAGVRYNAVALANGLVDANGKPDTAALRQRASRERWPIPSAVVRRAQQEAKKAGVTISAARCHDPSKPPRPIVSQTSQCLENGQKTTIPGENGQKVSTILKDSGEFEGNLGKNGGGMLQNPPSSADSAVTLAAENLLDLATDGSLHAARRFRASIIRSPESLPITSVGDLATATKALRSIAGLDKSDGPSVTVGLFSSQPGNWGAGVVTIDAVTEPEDDEGE